MDTAKFWFNTLVISPLLVGASWICGGNSLAAEVVAGAGEAKTSVSTESAAVAAPADYLPRSRGSGVAQFVPLSQLEGPAPQGSSDRVRAMGQVTSVSQLSDVQPTDWAFQALQSLVERYGCIAGYPDGTYRGNRPMTRYEFAAGVNACLDRVNELIASATADLVRKEDLDALQKLQEEFATELATLRGAVDGLEARLATVEAQQFSTTTKLNAEVIFGIAGALGSERAINSDRQRVVDASVNPDLTRRNTFPPANSDGIPENTIFGQRTRLNLDASFTGKDRLRARLEAANFDTNFGASTVTNTNQARLSFDTSGGNDVVLQRLEYRFPVGKRLTVFVEANAGEFNDNVYTFSPVESSARGSISRFGRFNPIYRVGPGGNGTGVTADYKLLDGRQKLTISAGYFASASGALGNAGSPEERNGLFNGSYAAIAQLRYQPVTRWNIGFTYVRAYSTIGSGITGATGTGFANNPFAGSATVPVPTTVNAFGLQTDFRITPKFIIAGWAGYSQAYAEKTVARIGGQGTVANPAVQEGDQANILNWAVALAFPDVLKEGALAGIVFGQPPYVTSSDFGPSGTILSRGRDVKNRREDENASWHIEGFYRYPINDNIDITPGLFVLLNPEGNSRNNAIFVGTIRTTFRF